MNEKIPVKYIGEIPCSIPGIGKIMPGQTIEVPVNMATGLLMDNYWKKSDPAQTDEVPAPVETIVPVEPNEPGLEDEKPKKGKRFKEES